jgi:hypothetical protein
MAITFSWSSSIINIGTADDPIYKKVGVWYDDGVDQGEIRIQCNLQQEPLMSESAIIGMLENT